MNCLQSVALMMVAMVVSASASGYGRGGGVGGWARGFVLDQTRLVGFL
jgi:hypothetical protein